MSTRHRRAPFGALLLAATLAACGGDRVLSPAAHTPSPSLQLYGQGSRAGLVTACEADGYRQFDFWVGKWSVGAIRPNGTIGSARSIVERELDGCVIEENWMGNARSMNTFDPATGTYNQQYFDAFGTQLILTGGVQADGSMRMTGRTLFACPQCPGGIFPMISVWTWTAITPDSVRQLQERFNGLNGASMGIGFDGRYRRDPSITLGPTPATGPCTNDPLFRQFDFAVGSWTITNGEANGVSASHGGAIGSEVTRELAGCLIEERIETAGGYRGWSFAGWNQSEDAWFRTYADNLGGRVFLSGGLDGQRMVMTGTRSLADGTQQRVRVSWTPESADRVVEAWELSPDDGATWVPAQEVVRIRRS